MRDIDIIGITGLRAIGRHGVLPEEGRDGQPFVVDVELGLEVITDTDDLAATVNYAEIADVVRAEIEGEPCQLIETLADRVARRCLAQPLVQQVKVTVHKPQAPVPHDFTDIFVTITRSRS